MKGAGKAAFLTWSDQRLINVHDSSDGIREGVLVMPIEGESATRSGVRYIDTIACFKQAVRAGEIDTPEFRRKQQEIDMGIAVGRELVEVFEVKTSTARSDIYTAIGQLMVHGTADDCRRVMVLPDKEPIAYDLKDALQRLGIELLKFRLGKEKVTIC